MMTRREISLFLMDREKMWLKAKIRMIQIMTTIPAVMTILIVVWVGGLYLGPLK